MDDAKARRLAERIAKIVAELLERRIKDPRLGFRHHHRHPDHRGTCGRLRSSTRSSATEEERAASAAALGESAKGILRSEVGRQTGIDFTPTLAFILDAIPEGARQIDELVAAARQRDEELARASEGATFAGEADPYRKPAATNGMKARTRTKRTGRGEDEELTVVPGQQRAITGDRPAPGEPVWSSSTSPAA